MTVEKRLKLIQEEAAKTQMADAQTAQPEAANQTRVPQPASQEVEVSPEVTPSRIPNDIRKPADVAPVDVAPIEDVTEELPPAKDDPKANKMWQDLRAKAKLADEYKAKVEQNTGGNVAELSKITAQLAEERAARVADREEFDNEYGQLDIQKQSTFKKEHDFKINQALAWAVNIGEKREGLAKEDARKVIERAFSIKDYTRRAAYLQDEMPGSAALVDNELMKADQLRDRRADAISNWRATQVQLTDTEQRLAQASNVKQLDQTMSTVLDELANSGSYYYERSKGTSPNSLEWNRGIDTRKLTVKQIVLRQDQAELVRYVADGLTARNVRADLDEADAKLKEANAKIAASKALKPRVDGRRPLTPDHHAPEVADGERMAVSDRIKMIARADYSQK